MKRYWAFAGAGYYPSGGMVDTHSSFDTQEEAETWARAHLTSEDYWAHVWDLERDAEVVSFYVHASGPFGQRKIEIREARA